MRWQRCSRHLPGASQAASAAHRSRVTRARIRVSLTITKMTHAAADLTTMRDKPCADDSTQVMERCPSAIYGLTRNDVAEVIRPYIEDLAQEDRRVLPWLTWNLLQEGMEMEYSMR